MALLLRYSSGNIVLFEATGETGVILTNWHDFLTYNWYEQYEKIVYRKLHFERPSELLMDLELFIKVRLILSQFQRELLARNIRLRRQSFVAIRGLKSMTIQIWNILTHQL